MFDQCVIESILINGILIEIYMEIIVYTEVSNN